MARPKLGESESKRLQMVITEDELKAIEDWQFENRVPSKSEAIRRLCQIAIEVDKEIEEAVEHARNLRDVAYDEWSDNLRLVRDEQEHPEPNAREFYRALLEVSGDIFERADRLFVLLVAAYNRIVPLIDGKTFNEAVAGSREAMKESQAIFEEINRKDREIKENTVIARVSQAMTLEEREAYEALTDDQQDEWWKQKIAEELGRDDEGEESAE